MKAVRLHGLRHPEVRVDTALPRPRAPRGAELLVRVAASSVNGTDLGLVRLPVSPSALRGQPLVLGFDVTGEVVACGPAVSAFEPGDRVMGLIGHGGGGQAELALLPSSRVARVPDGIPPEQAAALPLAGLTALQALHRIAGVHARPRPRVLVVGAAGGIGSFSVQLAALAGAHVTAVGTADRAGYLTGLGADEVVDRHEHDVLSGDGRWDVVLDAPGAWSYAAARTVLTSDGIVVSTRAISRDALRPLAGPLRRGAQRFASVRTRADGADLARLAHLVTTGRLRVPVDRVFALDDVLAAHRHASSGQVRGKVVLTV